MTSGTAESSHLKPRTGREGTLGMPQSFGTLNSVPQWHTRTRPQPQSSSNRSTNWEPRVQPVSLKGPFSLEPPQNSSLQSIIDGELQQEKLEEVVTICPQSEQSSRFVNACAQLSLLLHNSGFPSQGMTPVRVGRSPQISLVQEIPHKHSQRLFYVILDCIKLTVKTSIAHRVF